MESKSENRENQSRINDARLIIDFFHRLSMHNAMWFMEVKKELGEEKADKALRQVYDKSIEAQMNRLSKVLGFEMDSGIPKPLLSMPEETMLKLKESMAVNWLANDGIWFQAVEFTENMTLAKKCNDLCWKEFSPLEAWSVKKLLNLPENSGLQGLKQALEFRFYAFINKQSITEEKDNSFVFSMNDCRVQSARKRKGLDDYPCKSAGVIEYTSFAETIDSRIKTSCIGCPPDKHPDNWYCSWKFSI